jgi:hypothetical protein
MAKISINGGNLVVGIEGLDKLWALKSQLVIPLANVRGATADPGIIKEPKGLRGPGAASRASSPPAPSTSTVSRCSGTSTTRPRPWSSNWPTTATPG